MDITIYSTSTCSYCHALSEWLDEQKITYKKVITDKEPDGMAKFMAVNDDVISVPLTIIKDTSGNETKIHGFDKDKFKQTLGL
jgi:glutaredoxin